MLMDLRELTQISTIELTFAAYLDKKQAVNT